jgi:hypothetical protein
LKSNEKPYNGDKVGAGVYICFECIPPEVHVSEAASPVWQYRSGGTFKRWSLMRGNKVTWTHHPWKR